MTGFDPLELARGHSLVRSGPAVRFMEGALLGNGGLGVVVTTRPDAVVLRLGHNEIWDERIDESHASQTSTFADVFARVREAAARGPVADDPWMADYIAKMESAYRKPYPRPYPCGSVILGFDRRRTELLGHRLDLATGECFVSLRDRGRIVYLEIVVDQEADHVLMRVVDDAGHAQPSPFDRIRLLPDVLGPTEDEASMTAAEAAVAHTIPNEPPLRPTVSDLTSGCRDIAFSEALPAATTRAEDAHRSIVGVLVDHDLVSTEHPSWYGGTAPPTPLERGMNTDVPLSAVIVVNHERGDTRDARGAADRLSGVDTSGIRRRGRELWAEYWQRSGVRLDDTELERCWYRNTYFTHCCLRPSRQAPGLFGNWSLGEVGTAWHGDYHMNYNTQQLFWGVFSSNRVDAHLPYVDLVEDLMPLSTQWARNYWGLDGACFPHSAYPVPMSTVPYPSPVWGWEICETPWTVQSLWWHYRYTLDTEFLRTRALPPMRAAVTFLVGYLTRPEASGPSWGDDRLHVFPTVVPEVYGLTPRLELNRDCIADLALTKFLLKAYLDALDVVGSAPADEALRGQAAVVLDRMVGYATASTPDGEVFVAVPGEDPDVVYNIPLAGMTVFPGEEHSWHSDPATLELARRSVRRQRLEGGNELVFANLQAARLGILDLGRFKRQLAYCELPNGTLTDMVLEVHGRYGDATPFDFMADMGVFVENFAITAVINEMLLQSSTGTIRVFPNEEPLPGDAEFHTLRAEGAFLVSAASTDGQCQRIEVTSERGAELRILLPWDARVESSNAAVSEADAGIGEFGTLVGETLVFTPSTPA